MLKVFTLDDCDEWDKTVKSFNKHDVYYLSGYTEAFYNNGDGIPMLLYFETNSMRAINVVMKRDISKSHVFKDYLEKDSFFDLSTPYGYGGFLIEGNVTEEQINYLNEEYSDYCKKNNIISEFVRFHPVLNNIEKVEKIYNITTLGNTVTMDIEDTEDIWANLDSKNRNVIRKAIKSGVKIFWGRSRKLYDEFIPMYNATMDKDSADEYYYFGEKFYESILNGLEMNHLIFYAVYENKIISMAIILFKNKQMHYHLSASNPEFRKLAATNYLLYMVGKWGSENGYQTLHLGGGFGGSDDPLYSFKKKFNKKSSTKFSIGKKIFDEGKYNYLVDLRSNLNKESNFFPLYRTNDSND